MYEKLPFELDQALRIIASKKEIALRKPYIERLVIAGYITRSFFGGWVLSNNGREYLKQYTND